MPLFPATIPSELILKHRVIDGWFVNKSFRFSSEKVTKNCKLTPELRFNQKSIMLLLTKMHFKIHFSEFNTILSHCPLGMW